MQFRTFFKAGNEIASSANGSEIEGRANMFLPPIGKQKVSKLITEDIDGSELEQMNVDISDIKPKNEI